MLRDEFLIQLQKFLNQIGLTLRQLEGILMNLYLRKTLNILFFRRSTS
jgi:hypothetical protein